MKLEPSNPQLYFDAPIEPSQSLSGRGAILVLAPLAAVSLILALVLLHYGAIFAPPFLGLDLLGLAVALHISARRPRIVERVQISADEVRVLEHGRGAERLVWRSHTTFTRIELDLETRLGPQVRLLFRGKSRIVGGVLGPDQRVDLCARLRKACAEARAERFKP